MSTKALMGISAAALAFTAHAAVAQDQTNVPIDCTNPANAALEQCLNLPQTGANAPITNFAPLVGAGAVAALGLFAGGGGDGGGTTTTGTTSTTSTTSTN